MKTSLVDVSVLILFFNRPDRLQEVFRQVCLARPARLFLYQDGSRGAKDDDKVLACRAIVDDDKIDWQCEVLRNYQSQNAGCDPSGYNAQSWAFQHTDKLIILEDDCVPAVSFFTFCKVLLDRYEDDPHVWMIAGFNAMEKANTDSSYFFTDVFSIWGWASWKRVHDTWDSRYSWLEDSHKVSHVAEVIRRKRLRSDLLTMCYDHQQSGIAHFETILWASMLLHDAVAIMTSLNQVNNIGVEEDSTHFTTTLATMPRRMRRQFLMPRYEIALPLVEPTSNAVDDDFKEQVYRLNAWDHPWRKVQYSVEELAHNLRRGRLTTIARALSARLSKTLHH